MYKWVEPKMVAEKDGKRVYRVYMDGKATHFWFTTARWDDEIDRKRKPSFQFDIRRVLMPAEIRNEPIQTQLEYIIDNSLVPFPGEVA